MTAYDPKLSAHAACVFKDEEPMSEDFKLPTQSGLRAHSKEMFDEDFESDVDCFTDTFLNGQFHEERAGDAWRSIAYDLPIGSLVAYAVLPICQGIVGQHHFEDDPMARVMAFYDSVGEWQRGTLEDDQRLISAIEAIRPLVAGWHDGCTLLSMLDYRVRHENGRSALELDFIYSELAQSQHTRS